MLEGGPVIEYFKGLAEDERNVIVFVSYQIEGTLGRRVQKGINEVTMMDSDGKISVIKVKMRIESIEGFSGHSDRRQIINYITQLKPRPEKVIVCHGERAKIASIASFIQKRCGIPTVAPSIMETIRLL
jgi:predicted metal-dependent RNase